MRKSLHNNKFIQLDALRGVACIIVIIHHYCLAFLPNLSMNYPDGFQKTPFYALINGRAAVIIFFALSGFVLSIKYFHNNKGGEDLIKSIIKRFPRLYLPSALSVILGYFVIVYTPHYFLEAGGLTGSSWLQTYAGGTTHFTGQVTFLGAIQSSFRLFFSLSSTYLNTNLWTMKPELFGSFIVFSLIGFYFLTKERTALWFVISATICLWAIGDGQYYIASFYSGMILAALHPIINDSAPRYAKYIVAILSVYLLRKFNDYYSLAAAVLLIYILVADRQISHFFSGKISALLGRFSFPLYLVHTIIICSLSSYIYISFENYHYVRIILSLIATIVGSILVAIPFVYFDERWVKYLNQFTNRLYSSVTILLKGSPSEVNQ